MSKVENIKRYLEKCTGIDADIAPFSTDKKIVLPRAVIVPPIPMPSDSSKAVSRSASILSFHKRFSVFMRNLARAYFRTTTEEGVDQSVRADSFAGIFSYLSESEVIGISGITSKFEGLTQADKVDISECLLENFKSQLGDYAAFDTCFSPLDLGNSDLKKLVTVNLDPGVVRMPDIKTIVLVFIRNLARLYLDTSGEELSAILLRAASYERILALIERTSVIDMCKIDLSDLGLPAEEAEAIRQCASTEVIARLFQMNKTTITQSDVRVFKWHATELRRTRNNISNLTVALITKWPSYEKMLFNIKKIEPVSRHTEAVLAYVDAEYRAGEMTEALRGLLENLLSQLNADQDHLSASVLTLEGVVTNINIQCKNVRLAVPEGLQSVLDSYAAFDDFFPTITLESLRLHEPTVIAIDSVKPFVAFKATLLVAVRKAVRGVINDANQAECSKLLSAIEKASLEQLPAVIASLDSPSPEIETMIKIIKVQCHEEIILECYRFHRALIEKNDTTALADYMNQIRERLERDDVTGEQLLGHFECLEAEIHGAARYCLSVSAVAQERERVECDMSASHRVLEKEPPSGYTAWLTAEEAAFDWRASVENPENYLIAHALVDRKIRFKDLTRTVSIRLYDDTVNGLDLGEFKTILLVFFRNRVRESRNHKEQYWNIVRKIETTPLMRIPGLLQSPDMSALDPILTGMFGIDQLVALFECYQQCNTPACVEHLDALVKNTKNHYQGISLLKYTMKTGIDIDRFNIANYTGLVDQEKKLIGICQRGYDSLRQLHVALAAEPTNTDFQGLIKEQKAVLSGNIVRFCETITVFQLQLYTRLQALLTLQQNIKLTPAVLVSICDMKCKRDDPRGFLERQKKDRAIKQAHADVAKLFVLQSKRGYEKALKAHKINFQAEQNSWPYYLRKYALFDSRYENGFVSLEGGKSILIDPYTKILIEVRRIASLPIGPDQLRECQNFLLAEDQKKMTQRPVNQRVGEAVAFLITASRELKAMMPGLMSLSKNEARKTFITELSGVDPLVMLAEIDRVSTSYREIEAFRDTVCLTGRFLLTQIPVLKPDLHKNLEILWSDEKKLAEMQDQYSAVAGDLAELCCADQLKTDKNISDLESIEKSRTLSAQFSSQGETLRVLAAKIIELRLQIVSSLDQYADQLRVDMEMLQIMMANIQKLQAEAIRENNSEDVQDRSTDRNATRLLADTKPDLAPPVSLEDMEMLSAAEAAEAATAAAAAAETAEANDALLVRGILGAMGGGFPSDDHLTARQEPRLGLVSPDADRSVPDPENHRRRGGGLTSPRPSVGSLSNFFALEPIKGMPAGAEPARAGSPDSDEGDFNRFAADEQPGLDTAAIRDTNTNDDRICSIQ